MEIPHINCFSHCLHNFLLTIFEFTDGTKSIDSHPDSRPLKNLIDKCRNIIKKIRRSYKASYKLKEAAGTLNVRYLKLKLDVNYFIP